MQFSTTFLTALAAMVALTSAIPAPFAQPEEVASPVEARDEASPVGDVLLARASTPAPGGNCAINGFSCNASVRTYLCTCRTNAISVCNAGKWANAAGCGSGKCYYAGDGQPHCR